MTSRRADARIPHEVGRRWAFTSGYLVNTRAGPAQPCSAQNPLAGPVPAAHTSHPEFDLPGVRPDSIDRDVERNVVTVKAERPPRDDDVEPLAAERPRGVFSRQLVLGDNLDTEHITAGYDAGVLSLDIPVAEAAKPRKITVGSNGQDRQAIHA